MKMYEIIDVFIFRTFDHFNRFWFL